MKEAKNTVGEQRTEITFLLNQLIYLGRIIWTFV